MKPGTNISLTVLRKDKMITLPVTVGDYSAASTTAAVTTPQNDQYGIEVGALTPEIAQKMGNTQDQGVVITKVNPNSIAGMAGLQKGALILGVNRQKVTTVEEYNRAVAQAPKESPLLLQIRQGDNYLFVSLQ